MGFQESNIFSWKFRSSTVNKNIIHKKITKKVRYTIEKSILKNVKANYRRMSTYRR